MKQGIALVGFGTIGAGVVNILNEEAGRIRERSGVELSLRWVVDKDTVSERRTRPKGIAVSSDYKAALADPEVGIVIELVGGTGFAYTLIEEALKAGKHVVTANKALLAERGRPLFELAREKGLSLGFEASVCGGIPIIRVLDEALRGDEILEIKGIVNGTTNYILTRMEEEGLDFGAALSEAQRLGFAEAEPSLDIDGIDAAHKACILAQVAFSGFARHESIPIRGIRDLSLEDVRDARDLGFTIKLVALARRCSDGRVEIRVDPCLVPSGSQLSSIRLEYNAVLVESRYLGLSLYYGKGAGSDPTASAVMADVVDIALGSSCGSPLTRFKPKSELRLLDPDESVSRHYVRLHVADEPGVLSSIAGIFAKEGISIASVIQKERARSGTVPLVMCLHESSQGALKRALAAISAKGLSLDDAVSMRILS